MYKNNPCTAEGLKNEITRVVASVTEAQLQKVSQNLFTCCEACMRAEEGHFQQFLRNTVK
jgi:hypothetical protein